MAELNNRKKVIFDFEGTIAPTVQPFNEKGEVNLDAVGPYVRFLDKGGCQGVYLLGTTGEGLSLTFPEKVAVTKKWQEEIKKNNSKMLLIPCVSSTSSAESVQLATEFQRLGVDAIATLPPLYYKPSKPDDLVNYLKLIGSAAPTLPLLLYHIPSFNSLPVNLGAVIRETLKVVPQFIGMKYSDVDIVQFTALQFEFKDRFKMFFGFEEALMSALSGTGCTAGICAIFNLEEACTSYKLMRQLYKTDIEKAREEQRKISKLFQDVRGNGHFAVKMREEINKRMKGTVNLGKCRAPLDF